VRTLIVGSALLLLGCIALITGVLPVSAAAELAGRAGPILLFVAMITVVTELAAEAGVFQRIAEWTAIWGRGRTVALWLLVVTFATLSTVFLSLDTTAVLLTPVVVVLARHVGISPLPFALTTVWLANTASLLLPVSNLTNLLAEHELGGIGPAGFAALTWAPALAAVIIPTLIVFVVHRRLLTGRYVPADRSQVDDPVLFRWAAVTVALLVPALVTGLPVWLPASVAALVLVTVFAVRRRRTLKLSLVPWSLLVLASGLFLVVGAAHTLGLGHALSVIAGTGSSPLDLLQLAGVGAFGANAVNNLPAYLALEPTAGTPLRLIALLVGVNVGPLITPWASLATLLWHQRLTQLEVEISWSRYAALGLIAAPLTVTIAILALAFAQ
jgi:arsenical pump membrane protein